jgi:hypothetical protein
MDDIAAEMGVSLLRSATVAALDGLGLPIER